MKAIRASEHQHQCAVVQWFAAQHPKLDRLLFAIPNGGARHPVVAVKLKAEGVKPGVADLFLSMARCGFNGLYIELKADKGRLSDDQKAFGECVRAEGYKYVVAYGQDEAILAIKEYLAGESE